MEKLNIDFAVTKETLKAMALDIVRLEFRLTEFQIENKKLLEELEEKRAVISQLSKNCKQ